MDNSIDIEDPTSHIKEFLEKYEKNDKFIYKEELRQQIHKYVLAESTEKAYLEILLEDLYNFSKPLFHMAINKTELFLLYGKEALNDLTPENIHTFELRLYSENGLHSIDITNVQSNDFGKLVQINCEVKGILPIEQRYTSIMYQCPMCITQFEIDQIGSKKIIYPSRCQNKECKNKQDFVSVEYLSQAINVQYAWVMDKDKDPHLANNSLKIELEEDLIKISPGDKIKLFGVLSREIIRSNRTQTTRVNICLKVHNLKVIGKSKFQQIVDTYSRVYLNNFGMFLDKVSMIDCNTSSLYTWDEFHIEHKYRVNIGPSIEEKFSGHVIKSGIKTIFYNVNINDLKRFLSKHCSVANRKGKNYITTPLKQYLATFADMTDKVSEIIGFTDNGWKLPHNAIFVLEDMMRNEIFRNLTEVFEADIDLEEEKAKFIKFYELTGIKYKQNIFQWFMASPFSLVFRDYYDLMPGLTMYGPKGNGKTKLFEAFGEKCFGHQREMYDASTISKATRFEGFLTGSTLPAMFDDITHVKRWIVDFLKTHLTAKSKKTRLGAGPNKQFASLKQPKVSNLTMASNEPTCWFDEDPFLSRNILMYIDSVIQRKGWKKAKNDLQTGGVLRILYEFTKDWKKEDLVQYVDNIEIPDEIMKYKEKRNILTYMFFAFGKQLLKDIFDIDTDLEDIKKLIQETQASNVEALSDLIQYQIENGLIQPYGDPDDDEYRDQYHYKRVTWIEHYISEGSMEIDTEKIPCYAWRVNNIMDLQKQYEGFVRKVWKPKIFLMKIKKLYPEASYGIYYIKILNGRALRNKHCWAVMIPTKYFE